MVDCQVFVPFPLGVPKYGDLDGFDVRGSNALDPILARQGLAGVVTCSAVFQPYNDAGFAHRP
jgi:hypothetical protein